MGLGMNLMVKTVGFDGLLMSQTTQGQKRSQARDMLLSPGGQYLGYSLGVLGARRLKQHLQPQFL